MDFARNLSAMHDDLLPASACIDWADAQLPVLEGRIESWRKSTPYTVIEDLNPKRREKVFKLSEVKPLPPLANVEAGLIINSLRSSLDLLANILAKRNGFTDPKKVQFPITATQTIFTTGKHAGHKEIKDLSATHRKIIEDLQPWEGGHPHLFDIHTLDNARKHRRLISTYVDSTSQSISNVEHRSGFRWGEGWRGFENHSVIGRANIDAPKPNIYLSLTVTLDEGRRFPMRPLLSVLDEFSRSTREIIELFRES